MQMAQLRLNARPHVRLAGFRRDARFGGRFARRERRHHPGFEIRIEEGDRHAGGLGDSRQYLLGDNDYAAHILIDSVGEVPACSDNSLRVNPAWVAASLIRSPTRARCSGLLGLVLRILSSSLLSIQAERFLQPNLL